jgi:hypothetical protein
VVAKYVERLLREAALDQPAGGRTE